jgi:hypothetical protein
MDMVKYYVNEMIDKNGEANKFLKEHVGVFDREVFVDFGWRYLSGDFEYGYVHFIQAGKLKRI